jgi:glycerol-3-phosphate dehydrogenase
MFKSVLRRRNVMILTGATGGGVAYYYLRNSNAAYNDPKAVEDTKRYSAPSPWTPPSRNETLERLKLSSKNKDELFDLLVIGGGATGAGVALDAVTRGLRVALVEQNDFSSGMCISATSQRASLWSRA